LNYHLLSYCGQKSKIVARFKCLRHVQLIRGDLRGRAPPAGQVMTMAKPTTELAKRCKPPPYTHWDQRGDNPVLLSDLNLIDSDRKCKRLSFQTDDSEIAKGYMRLLVPSLVAQRRLAADSGAAKVYHPKGSERSRLKEFDTEVRRLKALPQAKYGLEALVTAKRWRLPVGIIHCLAERKPALNPRTYNTRRMRARQRGQRLPIGNTWEHRPQGGKCYFLNGKVFTARLHIDSRTWQWPLKVIDEEQAEALMAPVRVARQHLCRAAAEELNWELGTYAAVAAAVALAGARIQLAKEIIAAGGPKELADFVINGPKGEFGTASPLPLAVALKPTKQAMVKQCVEWLADLIRANPDRPPVRLAELRKQVKSKFGVPRRLFEEGNNSCIRQAQRLTKNFNWRKGGRPPGKPVPKT
jgi:hypothetical protein